MQHFSAAPEKRMPPQAELKFCATKEALPSPSQMRAREHAMDPAYAPPGHPVSWPASDHAVRERGSMGKDAYQVKRNGDLWPHDALTREEFVTRVWEEGGVAYRDLPWRNISDPYAVLVSEVMLQQTQVSRVESYWKRFLDAFPTVQALAEADTAQVLALWQGLGYNRRALALKRAAEQAVAEHGGALPETFEGLTALPGIGPATAAGILAFAHEKPAVYVETNVRAVFIHELFPDEDRVPDADLLPYVADTADTPDPRGWYYALLDWGAALKRSGVNPTRASTSYARQSPFEGSRRQKRAELVRIVLAAPDGIAHAEAKHQLDEAERAAGRDAVPEELFTSLVDDLAREGFLVVDEGVLTMHP